MKFKFITENKIKNGIIKNYEKYLDYEIERENLEEVNLTDDTYYFVEDSDIEVLNANNSHKMILCYFRPNSHIIALKYGYKPIAGIHITNLGDRPSFLGLNTLLDLKENEVIDTVKINQDYGVFKSKKHTTLFPMLIEYLEKHQEYLNKGKN